MSSGLKKLIVLKIVSSRQQSIFSRVSSRIEKKHFTKDERKKERINFFDGDSLQVNMLGK